MKNDNIVFIGLDTHKEQTQVAYTLDHRTSNINDLGRIQTSKTGFVNLARQLQSKYPHAALNFVYEAGPCGYWVYRLLTSLGHCCPKLQRLELAQLCLSSLYCFDVFFKSICNTNHSCL